MPGIKHRIQKPRALRRSAPRLPFSPAAASTLPRAPQVSSQWNRSLVTAFPSPTTIPAFAGPIPGSMFPACYFALFASRCLRPFGLSAPQPLPGLHPVQTASTLQARCGLRNRLRPLPRQPPLPFRILLPRDQSVQPASPRTGPPSGFARFPLAPRRQIGRASCRERVYVLV